MVRSVLYFLLNSTLTLTVDTRRFTKPSLTAVHKKILLDTTVREGKYSPTSVLKFIIHFLGPLGYVRISQVHILPKSQI